MAACFDPGENSDVNANKGDQDDEVLALENIFSSSEDDAFRIAARYESGKDVSNWTGCIEVSPRLPPNFRLQIRRKDSKDGAEDTFEEHRLDYLPPFKLYFTFPSDYPTSSQPGFTLTCEWLSRTLVSQLCLTLDEKWRCCEGSPVLFQWAMFLREEALPSLNVTEVLKFESTHGQGQGTEPDKRAIGRLGHESVNFINALLEYNEKKRRKAFEHARHLCDICGEYHAGRDCMEFHGCRHVFCRECLRNYFQVQIAENRCHALICPESKCDSQALPSQVREIVGEELFRKYDRLLLASSLDKMEDVCYCPRTFCQAPVLLDAGEMGHCPKCFFVFCNRCRRSYHGLAPCRLLNEEKRKLYQDYVTGTAEVKAELEKKYGLKQIKSLVAELDSEAWLDENSKLCPSCNARIEKSGGCNKMSCWKCGAYFCWLCQAQLSKDNPYAHFSAINIPCFNQLFAGNNEERADEDAGWYDFMGEDDDDSEDEIEL